MTAKIFKDKVIVQLIESDRLSEPHLKPGDHYQLATWNAIHYITALTEDKFQLDESLGEKINLKEYYAIIENTVQEAHIPTRRVVVPMTNQDRSKYEKIFIKEATAIAKKNGHI